MPPRYTLSMCDIVEVFPDRDMFVQGEQWLRERQEPAISQVSNVGESKRRYATSTVLLID